MKTNFNANHHHACVDIGGTKVAVSLISSALVGSGTQILNKDTPLLARQVAPTVKTGSLNALPLQIVTMIDAACLELGITRQQIASVGVSSCGPFLNINGLIELSASNICGGQSGLFDNDWVSIPLQACLQQAFPKVRIENDAVAALAAEMRWGVLQNVPSCAYVTWSTGIGMGLCVDGRILRGKNGNAGHAGHMIVADGQGQDLQICGCGNAEDLQAQIGGSSIVRRWGISAGDLMLAARAGDATALGRIDQLCEGMGRAIYNLTTILDLECVALGGSVFMHNQDLLLRRVQAAVMGRFAAMTEGLSIVPAGLGIALGDFAALALLE